MATKEFKQAKIDAMKEKLAKAKVAVLTEYRGLSVEEITNLRRELQKNNGDYMVTKNTLAKLVFKGTEFEVLSDLMQGPTAIAFGFEDQVAPAKVVDKFIKENKKGEIIAAALDGKLYNADETKELAKLGIKTKFSSPKWDYYQTLISRGDETLGEFLYQVYKRGGKLGDYKSVAKELKINTELFTTRNYDLEETLPWDNIDIGVTKKFLQNEYKKAMTATTTPTCNKQCNGCGLNAKGYCKDAHGNVKN